MTNEQFEVLASLMRSREPAKSAARLVLVEGWAGADAARETGLTPQSVSNAVGPYRAADAAIRSAYPLRDELHQDRAMARA